MDMQVMEKMDARPSLAGRVAIVTGSTSGIGLGIARALAEAGADVVINGFGDARRDRAAPAPSSSAIPARSVLYNGANLMDPAAAAGLVDDDDRRVRPDRHPRQQCRHPVRQPDRGFPGREMGRDHRAQPVGRVPHHPRRLRAR